MGEHEDYDLNMNKKQHKKPDLTQVEVTWIEV